MYTYLDSSDWECLGLRYAATRLFSLRSALGMVASQTTVCVNAQVSTRQVNPSMLHPPQVARFVFSID